MIYFYLLKIKDKKIIVIKLIFLYKQLNLTFFIFKKIKKVI